MNPEPPTAETKEPETGNLKGILSSSNSEMPEPLNADIPTPRTDAMMCHGQKLSHGDHAVVVPVKFSRCLERELLQAQAQIVALREGIKKARDYVTPTGSSFSRWYDSIQGILNETLSQPAPPVVAQAEHERVVGQLHTANLVIGNYGGWHASTPREREIEEALGDTPAHQRDSAEHAIGELLSLIQAMRGDMWKMSEEAREANADAESLAVNLAEVAAALCNCGHPACTNCDRVNEAQKALAAHEARKEVGHAVARISKGGGTAAQRLAQWYEAQCNGDWEHSHGIRLRTVDNPGFAVEIDLDESQAEGLTGKGSIDGITWEVCLQQGKNQLWGYDEGSCDLERLLGVMAGLLEEASKNAGEALEGTAEADKSVRAPVPAVEWHNPNGTSFERLGERHRFLVPEEVDGRFGQYQTPRAEYYVTDQKKWVPADTADAGTITYRVPISTPLPDGRVVGIHVSRETGKEVRV